VKPSPFAAIQGGATETDPKVTAYQRFLKVQRAAVALARTIQAKAVRRGQAELAHLFAEWIDVQDEPGETWSQIETMAEKSTDLLDRIRARAGELGSRELAHDEVRLRRTYASVAGSLVDLARAWQPEAPSTSKAGAR
jgi:hypothetical protein